MKKTIALWDRLWFAPYDPLPLGFLRISLGTLILVTYLALYPNWDRYFDFQGVISLDWADLRNWPLSLWSVFQWTKFYLPVPVFWWLGLLAAISFTVGWQTRASTILLYVLQMSMNHQSTITANGEDHVFRTFLFFGCFAPLGATLSVDAWRRRKKGRAGEGEKFSVWPVRLMQISVALIYVFTIYDKLRFEPSWRDGTAMYWILMNRMWSAWPWPKLLYGSWAVSKILTFATVAFEAGFPILVWFRRTRPFVLVVGVLFHLGIAVFLSNVEIFTLGMICTYWVFIPAGSLRSFLYHFDNIYRFEKVGAK